MSGPGANETAQRLRPSDLVGTVLDVSERLPAGTAQAQFERVADDLIRRLLRNQ